MSTQRVTSHGDVAAIGQGAGGGRINFDDYLEQRGVV